VRIRTACDRPMPKNRYSPGGDRLFADSRCSLGIRAVAFHFASCELAPRSPFDTRCWADGDRCLLDFSLQVDLSVRMLIAAVLGAAIGLEREIHAHPAGMRTHLLVSLGSAVFTVLSVYGFAGVVREGVSTNVDPTRIAAQIVSGIGFLGAGAILKYGTSIRGLTTAASLWTAAAIGLPREQGNG
jgi:hypothetical protein